MPIVVWVAVHKARTTEEMQSSASDNASSSIVGECLERLLEPIHDRWLVADNSTSHIEKVVRYHMRSSPHGVFALVLTSLIAEEFIAIALFCCNVFLW